MSEPASADLVEVAIARVRVDEHTGLLESGLLQPLIYTDALKDWPALGKWSLDYFGKEFGDHFGLIPASFLDGSWGKATCLRDYLSHLDDAVDKTPGFWVDDNGLPLAHAPAVAAQPWAFYWHAFSDYPQLYRDLGPYPPRLSSLVAGLPQDVSAMLEWITRRDFFSIYMSRKGTITPLHADFHGTTGSLAQFEGTKHVTLFAPGHDDPADIAAFDPDQPDYARFPQLSGRIVFRDQLQPGELLIIPPGWWHHVRSEEHTLTLSHNFFTPLSLAPYLHGVFRDMCSKDMHSLKDKLTRFYQTDQSCSARD